MLNLFKNIRNVASSAVVAASMSLPAMAEDSAKASVVLVHGAFADGSAWLKVIPLLQAEGVEVAAVQLPLASLPEDAAITTSAVDTMEGPVVLVGHSYGGAVISEAGNSDKVEALVYVAALTLDAGQPIGELFAGMGEAPFFQDAIVDARGHTRLSAASYASYFMPDVPAAEAAVHAAAQGPFHLTPSDTLSAAAWADKPSYYVLTQDDQILPAQAQGYFAQKMGSQVIELAASHAPMLSQPQAVADVILSAVAAVSAD